MFLLAACGLCGLAKETLAHVWQGVNVSEEELGKTTRRQPVWMLELRPVTCPVSAPSFPLFVPLASDWTLKFSSPSPHLTAISRAGLTTPGPQEGRNCRPVFGIKRNYKSAKDSYQISEGNDCQRWIHLNSLLLQTPGNRCNKTNWHHLPHVCHWQSINDLQAKTVQADVPETQSAESVKRWTFLCK